MTVKKDNLVFIILCGIPCAGKSTWVRKNTNILAQKYNAPVIVISRDDIREATFDMKTYKYGEADEKIVTSKFYKQLSHATNLTNAVIILDNTHVKPSRIDIYFSMFKSMIDSGRIQMYVKFFEVPLWKAKWRNYWRNKRTGKYISREVFNGMLKNYNKLDKTKWEQYEY